MRTNHIAKQQMDIKAKLKKAEKEIRKQVEYEFRSSLVLNTRKPPKLK